MSDPLQAALKHLQIIDGLAESERFAPGVWKAAGGIRPIQEMEILTAIAYCLVAIASSLEKLSDRNADA